MYYRETIVAGKTIMRSLRATTRIKTRGEKRKAKCNPTPAAVAKVNYRNRCRVLTAKLNHNFSGGDLHVVLTYADVPSEDQAKKDLDKFLRNMRTLYRKNDKELKWVAVTEYKHTRIHHHVVIGCRDLNLICRYWLHGHVKTAVLDDSGNYQKLAEYLLKETEKTFREPDSPTKNRYRAATCVIMPEIKREKVAGREVNNEIKPPKGYYLDEDSVRKYDHAILGVECMEYTCISLGDEPRLKRWPKGRKVRPERWFREDEQLSILQLSFEMGGRE